MKYIAYYRVSTQRQGTSGLGLGAQQAAVNAFIAKGSLVAEYTDIESGKHDSRPQLELALQHAKECGATLIIAKLDRLSRNLTFISKLMDAGVKFKCCDMPDATELTIHIFAAIAQHERKAISERTSAALKALKDRGVKLGKSDNFTEEGRKKGHETMKRIAIEKKENSQARVLIQLLRDNGVTLAAIAKQLNDKGFKTSKGKEFTPTQVSRLC